MDLLLFPRLLTIIVLILVTVTVIDQAQRMAAAEARVSAASAEVIRRLTGLDEALSTRAWTALAGVSLVGAAGRVRRRARARAAPARPRSSAA